jgi:hypothetical protein
MRNRFWRRCLIVVGSVSVVTVLLAIVFAPYSRFSTSLVISAHRIFRHEFILSNYADRLESKHTFFREPSEPASGLPGEFEEYLIERLHRGSDREKESILRFYFRTLPFTFCCWHVAEYENKRIIGDVLRLAKNTSDREQRGALMLVESLRINRALFKASLGKGKSKVPEIFELYEVWWQSSQPLEEKLKKNPLVDSNYSWIEP